MASGTSPGAKEIAELLVKLKAGTPDYPAHLMAARKTAFLNQAAVFKIQGKGQGGGSGQQGGGGGSGSALGGSTTAQGIFLQSVIGLGLVAAMIAGMLTGGYLFRDQTTSRSEEKAVSLYESPEPTVWVVKSPSPTPTESPTVTATLEISPTPTATMSLVDEKNDALTVVNDTPNGTQENQGLHLGETPGTPAAPGQGNPGNGNQPDQPNKPDKPEKPGKPEKKNP